MLRRLSLVLVAVALLATLASLTARAQETWTSVSPPTTQTLWGIAYSSTANLFVAVGEGGTIVTSPDGLAWTTRTSGTTQWLLGIAYAADLSRFVVVGDHGAILTSLDAITWTARPSNTTQRLNGIAASSASTSPLRFLAVGEAGTVLTSPDGTTWVSHSAPTTGWLRGVAYGAGRFVISGQAGVGSDPSSQSSTVFTTTDSAQFDSVSIFPPGSSAPDLEALAFDGTRFAVAGRSLVALASPSFPLVWQTTFVETSGISTPPFRNFRGVTFFNNTWVAVGTLSATTGSNSPIVFAQPNSSYQSASGLSATTSLNAVAASPAVAVAVGAAGTVYRAVATQSAPQPFLASPSSAVIAAVGSTVQLTADARGSAPMTYQWNFDNRPIVGATQPTLTLSNLSLEQSGNYSLSFSNPFGAATSAPYYLTVVGALAVTAPVDPNFKTPVTASPSTYLVQPDGKILVYAPTTPVAAGTSGRLDLIRLNPDGTRDLSFHEVLGAALRSVELLPNGQILLGTNDAESVRLNADGTVDPSFARVRLVGTHRVLADGRIIQISYSGNVATLTRFNADGSPDLAYAAPAIALAPSTGNAFDPNYHSGTTGVDSQGRIVVAPSSYEQVGTGVFYKNESRLFRLLPDGTFDASFPVATVPAGFSQFTVVGDKYYYVAAKYSLLGSLGQFTVARLNPDGSADLSYRPLEFSGSVSNFPFLQLARDGSLYSIAPNSPYLATPQLQTLFRYDPEGVRDADFSAHFSPSVAFSRMLPIDGDRLLISGNFTQLNGSDVSYFARLLPDTHASATRLTNLSVRQFAGAGNQTLIVGFVIHGQGPKRLLLRGVGPTLTAFNLPSPLPDPSLALFDSLGALRVANDNWSDAANASEIAAMSSTVGAFALPPGSRDAAALATLGAGAYTMQIGASSLGVALAEGYDGDATPADPTVARVVNFSARGNAGLGDNSLIAGFNLSGPNVKRVLLRAVGPGLTQFGVGGVLADPQLTVYRGSTAISSNDNWNSDSTVSLAATAVGAFPLNAGSKDAALLLTLPAGSYTAKITGVGETSGVALVEIYEVP